MFLSLPESFSTKPPASVYAVSPHPNSQEIFEGVFHFDTPPPTGYNHSLCFMPSIYLDRFANGLFSVCHRHGHDHRRPALFRVSGQNETMARPDAGIGKRGVADDGVCADDNRAGVGVLGAMLKKLDIRNWILEEGKE